MERPQFADENADRVQICVARQGRVGRDGTKTENSVREIYLSDEAIRLLVEDRKNHPFSPYMFPSPKTGGMYGPDCVGRIHKKLLEKAGIEEHADSMTSDTHSRR